MSCCASDAKEAQPLMSTGAPLVKASAPGKVLILGGYVIVEQNNAGISVGVNARFTTQLVSSKSLDADKVVVHVQSSQFHQRYTFEATLRSPGVVAVQQVSGTPSVFLQYAVLYSVAAATAAGGAIPRQELQLELLADNDFYSQRNYLESKGLTVSTKNLRTLPPHLPLVGEVSKTGLGSSAAMTTSAVACLYTALHGKAEPDHIHAIAQIAHSVAQKKVGSGFDVYTAVYGTCAYRRFSPEGVAAMLTDGNAPDSVELDALQRSTGIIRESARHTAFRLPSGLRLLLGDIHAGGSSTPGMVVKIMDWKKSVADQPGNLWEELKAANETYVEHLQRLLHRATAESAAYEEAVGALQKVPLQGYTPRGAVEQLFVDAQRCARESRRLLRQVGVAAGVPVEPPELTGLLDETAALKGVFATGCPGAGGYDAIFALAIGDDAAAAVEAFWESKSVCPLLVREDPNGLVVEGNNA